MPEYTLDDYIRLIATHANSKVRSNAAWQLGRYHDFRGIQPLINASTDADAEVRVRVMEGLGAFRDEAVLLPLINGLSDEDAEVRAMAAQALGAVGHSDALASLMNALNDPISEVRSQVIASLGALWGAEGAIQAILNAFIHDEDATVRYASRQTLTKLGGADVVLALIHALNAHPDDAPLLIELIEILASLRAKEARDTLETLLHHPDEGVQATATWAMGQIG